MEKQRTGENVYNPDPNSAGFLPPPPPYSSLTDPAEGKHFASAPPYDYQGYYPPAGGYVPPYPAIPDHGLIMPPSNVTTVQPTILVTPVPLANAPPDYLGYSIFTLLCCCWPIGIAALIYSIGTRDAIAIGNLQEAHKKSRTSRNLNHSAVACGIVIIIIVITLNVINIAYLRHS
ncbi:proline-rich transmembrane protein 1-like [Protopterus annectens]|uniref:proline-rich transmembrane protein 1-like n=1 Tax=Protopterus annectens TaxID=7888 RepID=UPI001CF96414|nr:proline-rich transmembrane protein 1-like [Protopterus annectens]